MDKKYDPSKIEQTIYEKWMDKDYFKTEVRKNKKPFTIIMPPPNITGQLHIGHAYTKAIQDAIIRFKRMQGFEALWLPGTDHAAIATEAKVVSHLKSKGLTKKDVGREKFLDHMDEWYKKYGDEIINQIKKMGASCDWSKQAFTLDEKRNESVKAAFVELYNKGLIYKGSRIINWCPNCKTSISDIEVEYKENNGKLWYVRYPIENSNRFLIVATTRPETIPGDTGVAIHPEDERYNDLIGKNALIPISNKKIPIIADEYVDREFGTGALKITPAHDPNDYEVGQRHDLDIVKVMNDDGTMNDLSGKYIGLDRYECRKDLIDDLKRGELLEKEEKYLNKTSHCGRCDTTIETIISKQWFVKMKGLAEPAIEVVNNKDIKFHPGRFKKVYMNWMTNIQDWCISRQLWSGHRLPVYYCNDCENLMVETKQPKSCSKCNSRNLRQDEDVLDTWFSSALWPYSTLGWPNNTEELKYFFPTDVMVTGYDIIFFWVARMIFTSLEFTGKIPFKDVYLNGLIRDRYGRKMSKNLGNGVDPIELIDRYGADAMRFGLIANTSTGQDSKYKDENIVNASHFINKLWNASNFVLINTETFEKIALKDLDLELEDKWILHELNKTVGHVTKLYERYDYNLAANELYEFVWSKFCDWYIELSKISLYSDDKKCKNKTLNILLYTLDNILKLLHPLIPFATEEIYQNLPLNKTNDTIMFSEFPIENKSIEFPKEYDDVKMIMSIIKSIRNARANLKVKDNVKIKAIIVAVHKKQILLESEEFIKKLAGVKEVEYTDNFKGEGATELIFDTCRVYLPIENMIDFEKERQRLENNLEKTRKQIESSSNMLSNERFVANAPQKAKEVEKTLKKNQDIEQNILDSIKKLKKLSK